MLSSYKFLDNQLSTEDFICLFADASWGEPPFDLSEAALKNSYATFSVLDGERTIAMARLLGDGAMAFYLKDFVVAKAYQGKGIGKQLLEHIETYIRAQLKPGWKSYFELMSAPGKEAFYKNCGFTANPNDSNGAGMSKWIG